MPSVFWDIDIPSPPLVSVILSSVLYCDVTVTSPVVLSVLSPVMTSVTSAPSPFVTSAGLSPVRVVTSSMMSSGVNSSVTSSGEAVVAASSALSIRL